MVIERVTGGKPQEVRQAEKAVRDRDVARAKGDQKAPETTRSSDQVTAQVSDRSRAAIKAYRIAAESKPDISRANRVAEIKAKVLSGDYRPSSADVANAILDSVVKGR